MRKRIAAVSAAYVIVSTLNLIGSSIFLWLYASFRYRGACFAATGAPSLTKSAYSSASINGLLTTVWGLFPLAAALAAAIFLQWASPTYFTQQTVMSDKTEKLDPVVPSGTSPHLAKSSSAIPHRLSGVSLKKRINFSDHAKLVATDRTITTSRKALRQSSRSLALRALFRTKPIRAWLLTITTLMQCLLYVFVVDHVFHEWIFNNAEDVAFVRLGGISHSSVAFGLRYPHTGEISSSSRDFNNDILVVEFRRVNEASWTSGPTIAASMMTREKDFLGQVNLTGLTPSTAYQYRWVRKSPYANESGDSSTENVLYEGEFMTFPTPMTPTKFTFTHTSCIKPNFPYGTKGVPAFPELSARGANFSIFLGDFIYIDSPYRFPLATASYRKMYRQVFALKEVRAAMSQTPFFFQSDDHELKDNAVGSELPEFPIGNAAWREYLGATNPVTFEGDANFYTFAVGNVAFFVLDTRQYRVAHGNSTTMLGAAQLAALKQWLRSTEDAGVPFKFIVSSVPFTLNFRVQRFDSWAGPAYVHEREHLLQYIHDNAIKNVIILSGDKHVAAISRCGKWGEVLEMSVSPLQQFYDLQLPGLTVYNETGDDKKLFYSPTGFTKFGRWKIDTTVNPPVAHFEVRNRFDVEWEYRITAK